MRSAFSRAQAAALTQPDPWEPDETMCGEVQALLESAVLSHQTRNSADEYETFEECRLCGDVDGHNEGCPVPALRAWLEGGQ